MKTLRTWVISTLLLIAREPAIQLLAQSSSQSGVNSGSRIFDIRVGPTHDALGPKNSSTKLWSKKCNPGDESINCYGGLGSLADEHSSVLPPGTFGGQYEYLFIVAAKTCLNGDGSRDPSVCPGVPSTSSNTSGVVVLSSPGPDAQGNWRLDFAKGYGSYDEVINGRTIKGIGQIFLSPMDRNRCLDTSAEYQDPTFDLNYANPASVVVDPTKNRGSDSLLMVFEGTNQCVGSSGSPIGGFYSTVGIATSLNWGATWPSYRYNFPQYPLPAQNLYWGPNSKLGGIGDSSLLCEGNNCPSNIPVSLGRYAVLGAPVSLSTMIQNGRRIPANHWMGNQEPSAFVDDVDTANGTYLYILSNFSTDGRGSYPGAQDRTIGIARAPLQHGGELQFTKWYGQNVTYGDTSSGGFDLQSVTANGITTTNSGLGDDGGGLGSPIFPRATQAQSQRSIIPYQTCQADDQGQGGASISYVDELGVYLLTFVCETPQNSWNPQATPGHALFYSTNTNLSDQSGWSPPQMISQSWSPFDSVNSCDYDGWYSTFMSESSFLFPHPVGHISTSGFVFSLHGCEGKANTKLPRRYSSRTFTITVKPN
jgi:hypothetical protein